MIILRLSFRFMLKYLIHSDIYTHVYIICKLILFTPMTYISNNLILFSVPTKATLQEVASHKRALDTMQEKAGMVKSSQNSSVSEAVVEIGQRHDLLAANTKKNITELEWLSENLTVYQELCTGQTEWQKEMWDQLHVQTGMR